MLGLAVNPPIRSVQLPLRGGHGEPPKPATTPTRDPRLSGPPAYRSARLAVVIMLHYHYWSSPRTSEACLDIIEDYVSRFAGGPPSQDPG